MAIFALRVKRNGHSSMPVLNGISYDWQTSKAAISALMPALDDDEYGVVVKASGITRIDEGKVINSIGLKPGEVTPWMMKLTNNC